MKRFSFKKIISCVMALGLVSALAACDSAAQENNTDKKDTVKDIVGTWNEVAIEPRVLVVSEDGTYTFDEEKGTVKIDYEEHPDGSKSVWYTFTKDDGEFWASFAKNEESEVQNDLWSGQDGEMHFMRDGVDVKLTPEDYIHVWSSGRCYITFEKVEKKYVATITWSSSASESTQWIYNCTFDKETSSMVCKKGVTCTELTYTESGKEKIKTVYNDGSGTFTIKYGTLRWTDDKENAGADMYFLQIDDIEE